MMFISKSLAIKFVLFHAIFAIMWQFTLATLKEILSTNSHSEACTIRAHITTHATEGQLSWIEVNDIYIVAHQSENLDRKSIVSAYITPDCKHYRLLSVPKFNFLDWFYLYDMVPHGAYFVTMSVNYGYDVASYGMYAMMPRLGENILRHHQLHPHPTGYPFHNHKTILPSREPLQGISRPSACTDRTDFAGLMFHKKTDMPSSTVNNEDCQNWADQTPNSHPFSDYNGQYQHLWSNFCRNPTNDPQGAWCYLKDSVGAGYCSYSDCTGIDGFTMFSRKGFNNNHLSVVKLHEESSKERARTASYNFPIEKNFCIQPLTLLDRTVIDPQHYGLDESSESRSLNIYNSALHVIVGQPIACNNRLIGWEFIAENPGRLSLAIMRSVPGKNFKMAYKRVGHTTLEITESMIDEDYGLQYKCVRGEQNIRVKAGDYYGFYSESKAVTKLAPLRRILVMGLLNVDAASSRNMLTYEAMAVDIIEQDKTDFDGEDSIYYDLSFRYLLGLGLRPILQQDFVYTCTCSEDSDCSDYGDENMKCTEGSCHCRTGYTYNRKANRCALTMDSNTMPNVQTTPSTSFTELLKRPWYVVDMGVVKTLLAFKIRTPTPPLLYAELWEKSVDYQAGRIPNGYLFELVGKIELSAVEVIVLHGNDCTWKITSADGSKEQVFSPFDSSGKSAFTHDSSNHNFGTLSSADLANADYTRTVTNSEIDESEMGYTFHKLPWGSSDLQKEGDETVYVTEKKLVRSDIEQKCTEVIGAQMNNTGIAFTGFQLQNDYLWHTFFIAAVNRGSRSNGDMGGTSLDYLHQEQTYGYLRQSEYGIHNFSVGVSLTFSTRIGIDMRETKECTHVNGGPVPGKDLWLDCDTPVAGRYVALYMDTYNRYNELNIANVQLYTLDDSCYGDHDYGMLDVYLNKCSRIDHGCAQLCVNDVPCSYRCDCRPGYKLNSDGKTCSDINECNLPNPACKFLCRNTIGSFQCECPDGFYLDSDTGGCIDLDECEMRNGGCDHHCENTPGSFQCICKEGYYMSNRRCYDIDECLYEDGGCNYKCQNTQGSYICQCKPGHTLSANKHYCIDDNECLNPDTCSQKCENIFGSYRCLCHEGFTLGRDGHSCYDVDECVKYNGGCAQSCVNLPGTFKCACYLGYKLGENGKCIESKEIILQIGLDVAYKEAYSDVASDEYKDMAPKIESAIQDLCGGVGELTCQVVGALKKVNVSVLFIFNVTIKENMASEEIALLVNDLIESLEQKENKLTIDGNSVKVISPIQFYSESSTEAISSSVDPLCALYEHTGHCNGGKCVVVDGKPVCECPATSYGSQCQFAIKAATGGETPKSTGRLLAGYGGVIAGFSILSVLSFVQTFLLYCIFMRSK